MHYNGSFYTLVGSEIMKFSETGSLRCEVLRDLVVIEEHTQCAKTVARFFFPNCLFLGVGGQPF